MMSGITTTRYPGILVHARYIHCLANTLPRTKGHATTIYFGVSRTTATPVGPSEAADIGTARRVTPATFFGATKLSGVLATPATPGW